MPMDNDATLYIFQFCKKYSFKDGDCLFISVADFAL